MGKKGSWFSAVKKVLIPESKEKDKEKKTRKSKGWFGRQKKMEPDNLKTEAPLLVPSTAEEIKLIEAENEQSNHAYSVAHATAVAAEAALASAMAAAEVVRLTSVARYSGKSKEEIAAVKIQSAFRGYTARRALRALKGLVRLKTMIQGQSVKRQATATLRCMQTLSRVQSQIRTRRIRMSEENEALHRQLQHKHEKELEKLRAYDGENWNDSIQTKEQMEANQQNKHEAALRRERAMAYAYSHQQTWRNSSNKTTNQTFLDPNNPHWGWSWMERWMAARPWEPKPSSERESNGANVVKPTSKKTVYAELQRVQSSGNENRAIHVTTHHSPSTPKSKAPSSIALPSTKLRSPSTRGSERGTDEDSRSMFSARSEYHRRHSIASSSIRDDESFSSTPAFPSYMASTESTKRKSRVPSPLGIGKNETFGSVSSTKKRLSFSGSPVGVRRHSVPPKLDISSMKDITAAT